ncbi:hypothetical protein ACFPMF_23850 [Larkinella bovis]|uniref:Uncharacterized protein n=1 Tax=Larkinella bovis TaxID=683041 RepID=A0ABW0IFW0_9BACT
MDFNETENNEVVILNDIFKKLNSFFVFALEWVYPLRDLFEKRPDDGKEVLNNSFRWLIESEDYRTLVDFNTIAELNSEEDNAAKYYDTRRIRTLIAARYCHFRDFESQQGYTRYLLELVHNVTWRVDLARTLFELIELDGFHQYFERDLLDLKMPSGREEDNEKYRIDELVVMLMNLTLEMVTSEIKGLSKDFTPKEYERWVITSAARRNKEKDDSILPTLKSDRFSLKQQMIAMDRLGFMNSTVWNNVGNQKKAKILSQLLGRNEQDIRAMLTYWGVKKTEDRYNTTKENDIKKVDDFLHVNLT